MKNVQVTLTFTDQQYEVLKHLLPFQKKTLGEYAVGAIISFLKADIDAVCRGQPIHDELCRKLKAEN